MIYPWKLNYWQTGEWQVVNERLKDMEKKGDVYNPKRADLFRSLSSLPLDRVLVVFVGQDPYPDHSLATGYAFSIPSSVTSFPPTLKTLLAEYSSDLGYPVPSTGNLRRWEEMGVLLWNAIPSCENGKSLSHDWEEWSYLTREVLTKVSDKGGVVFVFLGSVARRYIDCIDVTKNSILTTSHPSPRGSLSSKTPFLGSRIFTAVNDKLADLGRQPIDWRLDNAEGSTHSP